MQLDKDLMIQLRDANEAAFRQVFDQYGKKYTGTSCIM